MMHHIVVFLTDFLWNDSDNIKDILCNPLGGISLPGKIVSWLTEWLNMTLYTIRAVKPRNNNRNYTINYTSSIERY